jgi:hypothetical protein
MLLVAGVAQAGSGAPETSRFTDLLNLTLSESGLPAESPSRFFETELRRMEGLDENQVNEAYRIAVQASAAAQEQLITLKRHLVHELQVDSYASQAFGHSERALELDGEDTPQAQPVEVFESTLRPQLRSLLLREIALDHVIASLRLSPDECVVGEVNAIQNPKNNSLESVFFRVRLKKRQEVHIFVGALSASVCNQSKIESAHEHVPFEKSDFSLEFGRYLAKQTNKMHTKRVFVHVVDEDSNSVRSVEIEATLGRKIRDYLPAILKYPDISSAKSGLISALAFAGISTGFALSLNWSGVQEIAISAILLKSSHNLVFSMIKEVFNESFRNWEGLNRATMFFKRFGWSLMAVETFLWSRYLLAYLLPAYFDANSPMQWSEQERAVTNVMINNLARYPTMSLFYKARDLRLFNGGWHLRTPIFGKLYLKKSYLWEQMLYLPFFLATNLDLIASSGLHVTLDSNFIPRASWVDEDDIGGFSTNVLSIGRLMSFGFFFSSLWATTQITKILYNQAKRDYDRDPNPRNKLRLDKFSLVREHAKGLSEISIHSPAKTLRSGLNGVYRICTDLFKKKL